MYKILYICTGTVTYRPVGHVQNTIGCADNGMLRQSTM